MKVLYKKSAPKSRQKVYPPSGVCFDMTWQQVVDAVQEYRHKNGYTTGLPLAKENRIGTVFLSDDGIQFTYKKEFTIEAK